MNNTLDLIVIISSMATCLRLLFYRRHGAGFKRHISLLAWLLISITGGTGMMIITGKLSAIDINPLFILLLWVLTILVYRDSGNVASMLRRVFSQEHY